MFITSTYKFDILFACALVAHINVGREITSCQVTDVNRTIRIRKGGSDKISFEFRHNGRKGNYKGLRKERHIGLVLSCILPE